MNLNLPPEFIQTIQNAFKENGKRFIENLPALIEEASARWGLTDVRPFPNLSYNFVAFAKRDSSQASSFPALIEDVILKIGVPHAELTSEMAALKLFNGDGACQLLGSDEERGLLLLERLNPGTMLAELEDDDERTITAAELMIRLWKEAPKSNKFIHLSDWFDGLKKIRPHFNGGTGPFPKEVLERVESFLPELFADENVQLMHGDFHHFNILKSDRGWLAIDPKGVIGPAAYEVGPLMINPWNRSSDGSGFKVRAERRVSILSERLGWEREKIIKWSTAHAILSVWWRIEENMDPEYSMQHAKMFSELT
jgi:streptomycin 6-kinase